MPCHSDLNEVMNKWRVCIFISQERRDCMMKILVFSPPIWSKYRSNAHAAFTRIRQHSIPLFIMVIIKSANEIIAYRFFKVCIITSNPEVLKKVFEIESRTNHCQIFVRKVWTQNLYFNQIVFSQYFLRSTNCLSVDVVFIYH